MYIAFAFIFLLILIHLVWFLIIKLDKKRIVKYISNKNESLIDIKWKIFGKGWISEVGKQGGGNRIYKLTYADIHGNVKQAWCKTAMFSGVFMADEKVIEPAKNYQDTTSKTVKITLLEKELSKLKAETDSK